MEIILKVEAVRKLDVSCKTSALLEVCEGAHCLMPFTFENIYKLRRKKL